MTTETYMLQTAQNLRHKKQFKNFMIELGENKDRFNDKLWNALLDEIETRMDERYHHELCEYWHPLTGEHLDGCHRNYLTMASDEIEQDNEEMSPGVELGAFAVYLYVVWIIFVSLMFAKI